MLKNYSLEKLNRVMQSWAFNKDFWTNQNVEAFLSKIPKGNLLILDLYAEEMPHYKVEYG